MRLFSICKYSMMSKYLYHAYHATLFVILFIQCTLVYQSLNHKGIPLSNSLFQKYIPQYLSLSSNEVLFFLPFHIKIANPTFTQKADSLLNLDSPEIFISWRPNFKSLDFKQWEIHAYSGEVSTILYPNSLEANRISILISGTQIQNARMQLELIVRYSI